MDYPRETGRPVPRRPTGDEADAAIARIYEVPQRDQLGDAQLNALLTPFRGHDPLRMRCPKTGCTRTVVWCAFHPTEAEIVVSKNGPRKGAVKKMNRNGRPEWLRQQPPPPYDIWSLGPSPGRDSSKPANEMPGEHTRQTFTCRGCGRAYTLTNQTMMIKVITALAGNHRDFTP